MGFVDTYLGFVDMWECDENQHMNVRFYWSKFEAADRQFRRIAGLEGRLPHRLTRHVRYHAELAGGMPVGIRSARVESAPGTIAIVHEMRPLGSEAISATALDRYLVDLPDDLGPAAVPMPASAVPRGLDIAPAALDLSTEAAIEAGGAMTAMTRVTVAEADVDGVIEDYVHIARASDAAPHAWARLGMTRAWLAERGLGRVAVEMKLTYGERLRAGDLVHLVSTVGPVSRRTLVQTHRYFESRSGRPAAVCEVVALAMDMATRRAVTIPAEILERYG